MSSVERSRRPKTYIAQWLLIEMLEPTQPTVVAAGGSPKNRVPLATYFRGRTDNEVAVSAVRQAQLTRSASALAATGGRSASIEPILDHTGVPHAAWLRIARSETSETAQRNPAWAFTWDLTDGTAAKSPGLLSSGLDPSCTHWSIAEAMKVVDLGTGAAEALSQLVAAPHGTFHRAVALQHRPDGPDHRVDFITRITIEEDRRVLRGLSHDLGEIHTPKTRTNESESIGDLVAQGTIRPHQWRVIVDLRTLEPIYWYGPVPDRLLWRATDGRARIHPDDLPIVRSLAKDIAHAARHPSEVATCMVRFSNNENSYTQCRIEAQKIDLPNDVTAALVVLSEVS